MTDRPTRRAPETKARPAGSGSYLADDVPLAKLINIWLARGEIKSRTEGARKVWRQTRGNSEAAIVDRLVRLARKLAPSPIYPAVRGAASLTPSAAMSTATHTTERIAAENAVLRRELKAARLRIAELERARDAACESALRYMQQADRLAAAAATAIRKAAAAEDVLSTRLPRAEAALREIDARFASDGDNGTKH